MDKLFKNLNLRQKITSINMLITFVALFLAAMSITFYDRYNQIEALKQRLTIQADIIGYNISSSLVFDDPLDAKNTLSALQVDPHIIEAGIVDIDDKLFATYSKNNFEVKEPLDFLEKETATQINKELIIVKDIVLDGEKVGTVYIRSDLDEIYSRFQKFLIIITLVFIVSLIVALLLSFSLQKVLSGPIMHLLNIAKTVSEKKDYTIRAEVYGKDEIGALIKEFNMMLSQIEEQDRELREYSEKLEEIVEKRTNQLIQSQKQEAVGHLAGGIAHDFNNILCAIIGYTDLLRNEFIHDNSARSKLDIIKKSARRGANLTKQLLGFARKGQYEKKVINLNDSIKEVSSLLKQSLDKSIQIKAELSPDLWNIEGDPNQLLQVLMNLGLNAKEALDEGGTITFASHNFAYDDIIRHSDLGLREDGQYVKIMVSDTGRGIDPENIKKIFDPFFTTKDLGQGTGLGLAMVYGIIQNHGGLIKVYSVLNKGTEFHIYFPASEQRPLEPVVEKVQFDILSEQDLLSNKTILVVDDELIIRQLTKDILKDVNVNVYFASGGKEALELFKEKKNEIDLVLLDVLMPDMNGIHVYHEMIELKPDLQVVFISGYTEHTDILNLRKQGNVDFIQKPFSNEKLISVLSYQFKS